MKLIKTLFERIRGPKQTECEMGFVVYTSPGCRCSQKAIALLREYGVEPAIVDLESDEETRREYGASTPIIKVDGRVRFYGKAEPVLLRRLLEHRRRQEA